MHYLQREFGTGSAPLRGAIGNKLTAKLDTIAYPTDPTKVSDFIGKVDAISKQLADLGEPIAYGSLVLKEVQKIPDESTRPI